MGNELTAREQMLRVARLAGKLDVSVRKVWQMLSGDPTFPRPVRLGRATLWRESEVDKWLAGLGR